MAKVANVILVKKINSAFIDPRRVGGLIGYGQDNAAKLLTKDELECKLATPEVIVEYAKLKN